MKRGIMAFAIIFAIMILILISGCAKQGMPAEKPAGGGPEAQLPALEPGEWRPTGKDDCQKPELQQKCDEYCSKNPGACPGWLSPEQRGESSGTQPFTLPSEEEIAQLTRNYPDVIKAINEGPAMYGEGPEGQGSITDDSLKEMKETGFNTVQLFITTKQKDNGLYIEPYQKSILLNDIIKVKKSGLAVWVAFTYAEGPAPEQKIGAYDQFKPLFLEFVKETSKELEEYKVEYITVHTEPDLIFQNQGWSAEEVKASLIDFFPSGNAAARENFAGKIINKITELIYLSGNKEILDASLKNVDIAAIDKGPPPGMMGLEEYKKEFDDYQTFAILAKEKNVPWMVGEYWTYDYFKTPTDYVKENQAKLAQISFDAYLKTMPKGVGYTWNDFSAFSLQPNGEATRQEVKSFFEQLNG